MEKIKSSDLDIIMVTNSPGCSRLKGFLRFETDWKNSRQTVKTQSSQIYQEGNYSERHKIYEHSNLCISAY